MACGVFVCVFVWLCVCVWCVFVWLCGWVLVSRFQVWGFTCKCWFGHVRFPLTALPPDRPSPGPPLPPDRPFPRTALPTDRPFPRAARGFTRQPENSKRAHLSFPALQTPEFHEKTPREREKKNENGGGRGKKKREILGPPPFGPPLFLGFGPHPSGSPPFGLPTLLATTFSGFGPLAYTPPSEKKKRKKLKQIISKETNNLKNTKNNKKIQTINFKHLKP